MSRRLVVVSAGTGQPSSTRLLADRLAQATTEELRTQGVPVETLAVDVREHAHDLVNAMLTGFPPPRLGAVLDAVSAADGVIAVTPVFNASYSGLFKTFVDVLAQDSLAGTPVLLAATGGTARHSLTLEHAMRPLFSYLRAAPVATSVFAATEDWGNGAAHGDLQRRVERAAGELAAAVAAHQPASVTDPFASPTPFAQLLADR